MVSHGKPYIHEYLSPTSQKLHKHDLREEIYVLTDWFEIILKSLVSLYFEQILEQLSLIFKYSLGFVHFGVH